MTTKRDAEVAASRVLLPLRARLSESARFALVTAATLLSWLAAETVRTARHLVHPWSPTRASCAALVAATPVRMPLDGPAALRAPRSGREARVRRVRATAASASDGSEGARTRWTRSVSGSSPA